MSKPSSGTEPGQTCYRHWLAALELLLRKGLAGPLALVSLRRSRQIAAERTPHGEPIRLPRNALARAGIGETNG